MPAVRVSITTSEYLAATFSWYEIFASQTNFALGSVVANAEFSELAFATAFIHPNLIDGETWFYWVRAAYDNGESYSSLRALGSVTVSGSASSGGSGSSSPEPRIEAIAVTDPNGAALTTGDGKAYLRINALLDGYNLTAVAASVSNPSSSGDISIQLRRVRGGVDVLSTALTIDAGDLDSKDATTPAVIDTANDDALEGDQIFIDIDTAGASAKGLIVETTWELP